MRPSLLSYTFLLSFLTTIFFLQWRQLSSYPPWLWILFGLLGIFGIYGILSSRTRSLSAYPLASLLGIVIAFLAVERIVGKPEGPPFEISVLSEARTWVEMRIARLYQEPHSALLTGLLTGSRRTFPEHLTENFHTTGLTHIVAISGYNITLVLSLIGSMLFWLPKRLRLVPSVVAIIAFTIFAGASASVVRAAVMGVLGVFALHANREQTPRLTVLWAAFLMLVIKPSYLWNDAGFQLSFLALIGLMEISPLLLPPHIERTSDLSLTMQTLLATIAVTISTGPWIAFLFGRFSLIAPIANILVLPLIPWAMATGALAVLMSTLAGSFELYAAIPGWIFLEAVIRITEFLAKVPYASLELPGATRFLIVLYYVILAVMIMMMHIYKIRAQNAEFRSKK